MHASLGDCEFNMEGEDSAVSEAFQKWIAMVKQRARWPILKRIAELEAELDAQRRLLKHMDEA
jgi:flagellar biosynthesis chaperone FliJ